jgi:hypothetical protein
MRTSSNRPKSPVSQFLDFGGRKLTWMVSGMTLELATVRVPWIGLDIALIHLNEPYKTCNSSLTSGWKVDSFEFHQSSFAVAVARVANRAVLRRQAVARTP